MATEVEDEVSAACGELNLASKSLDAWPHEHFQRVDAVVERVLLHDNFLETVPSAAMHRLAGVRFLDLSRNCLARLPAEIDQMQRLRQLILAVNELERLPSSIGLLAQLQVLDVSANSLAGLPDSLGQLQRLVRLHLASNSIKAIPRTIANLANLRLLDVSGNSLRRVPAEIGHLPRLEVCNMGDNELESLPEAFFPESSESPLVAIDLSSNRLASLPDEFARLVHLRDVFLGRNALRSVPDCLGKLRHLRRITMHHNDLAEIPEHAAAWHHVRTIDVAHNRILRVSPVALRSWTRVEDLNLSHNKLRVVSLAFQHLHALRHADLRSNRIATLPSPLGVLQHLDHLRLDDNPICHAWPALRRMSLPQLQTFLRASHDGGLRLRCILSPNAATDAVAAGAIDNINDGDALVEAARCLGIDELAQLLARHFGLHSASMRVGPDRVRLRSQLQLERMLARHGFPLSVYLERSTSAQHTTCRRANTSGRYSSSSNDEYENSDYDDGSDEGDEQEAALTAMLDNLALPGYQVLGAGRPRPRPLVQPASPVATGPGSRGSEQHTAPLSAIAAASGCSSAARTMVFDGRYLVHEKPHLHTWVHAVEQYEDSARAVTLKFFTSRSRFDYELRVLSQLGCAHVPELLSWFVHGGNDDADRSHVPPLPSQVLQQQDDNTPCGTSGGGDGPHSPLPSPGLSHAPLSSSFDASAGGNHSHLVARYNQAQQHGRSHRPSPIAGHHHHHNHHHSGQAPPASTQQQQHSHLHHLLRPHRHSPSSGGGRSSHGTSRDRRRRRRYYVLVLERIEGSLAELRERGSLRETPQQVTSALAACLDALHRARWIHTCVSPRNFVRCASGVWKLANVAHATRLGMPVMTPSVPPALRPGHTGSDAASSTPRSGHSAAEKRRSALGDNSGLFHDELAAGGHGTAAYIAPELAQAAADHISLAGRPRTTVHAATAIDVWGFGLVMYEQLTGRALIRQGECVGAFVHAVLQIDQSKPLLDGGQILDSRTRDLLVRCLAWDPSHRPCMPEILAHGAAGSAGDGDAPPARAAAAATAPLLSELKHSVDTVNQRVCETLDRLAESHLLVNQSIDEAEATRKLLQSMAKRRG